MVYKNGKVNVYEHHKSMWSVSDFTGRGYGVHAIGLRITTASESGIMQQVISGIDFMLFPAWFLPQVGKHLVAYKDKHVTSVI